MTIHISFNNLSLMVAVLLRDDLVPSCCLYSCTFIFFFFFFLNKGVHLHGLFRAETDD